MSKTKDTNTTSCDVEASTPTSTLNDVVQRLETLNETLYRAGQLLASIDDRLTPRGNQAPSPAQQADSRRPLSNQPQWSQTVSGGW
jgi:hypothetical protein